MDYVAYQADFARGNLNRALVEQHRAFDPFIRAELSGKAIQAVSVDLVMQAVDDGIHSVQDVSFEEHEYPDWTVERPDGSTLHMD